MAAECHSLDIEKTKRNGDQKEKKRIKTDLNKDWWIRWIGLRRFVDGIP